MKLKLTCACGSPEHKKIMEEKMRFGNIILRWQAEQIFDELEKEISKFRLKRTGQQEISMIVRKLRKKYCGDEK